MQSFVANRYERKADVDRWADGGLILPRSIHGLDGRIRRGARSDPLWLTDMQKYLRLQIHAAPRHRAGDGCAPQSVDRDHERDLALCARARELPAPGWFAGMGADRR
jgi:hypothetical protein